MLDPPGYIFEVHSNANQSSDSPLGQSICEYTREDSNKSLKCRGNGNPEIGCASQCAEHCRWVDIKSLVAGCAELTPEARQRMISIGDSSTENTLPTIIAKPFNEVQTDRNS